MTSKAGGKRTRLARISITFFALIVLLALLAINPSYAQNNERCFPETGFCISGSIRTYWEHNGGLPVFGYPLSPMHSGTVEDWTGPLQWFERDRLEDHGEQGVMAGRLGAQVLEMQGRPWQSLPTAAEEDTPSDCRFFAATQHTLCEPFLGYWLTHGGMERYGYPITEPMEETIGDWTGTVQYFERRRMEYHPENTPPYAILLGLLGTMVYADSADAGAGPSDNGGQIVFLSDRNNERSQNDLFIMDTNGNNQRLLVASEQGDIFSPRWSPDGSRVVFVDVSGAGPSRTSHIRIVNADGTGMFNLSTHLGEPLTEPGSDEEPAWSPDGTRIVFASNRAPTENPAGNQRKIYSVNADGSGLIRLTDGTEGSENFPAWSPDGTSIAFTSWRDGNADIYVIQADGSGQTRLTFSPEDDLVPVWSPDGSHIAFQREQQSFFDIWVMQANGSNARNLTEQVEGGGTLPFWSPDGKTIAFSGGTASNQEIYTIQADGSQLRNVSNHAGSDWPGDWSPDGKSLVFASDRQEPNNFDIYRMERDGSGVRQLTNQPSLDTHPQWAP